MPLTPQQKKIKAANEDAKKMYNAKGNKLTWQQCIAKAYAKNK